MDGITDSMDSMDSIEQALGDSEGQRSTACYSPWGHKESEMTLQLNNSNPKLRELQENLIRKPVTKEN